MLAGLATVATVGCSDLGRLVPFSKDGIHAEKHAEEVAREHLESVYGKPLGASFIRVIRRDDGYFVLASFQQPSEGHSHGHSHDRDFATIAISTDWEVVAVDYTNEARRLKDPMAIATKDRENALPAQTTERLIRQATAQGTLPPS
ncbi:MAG TPA: hypothetical protein VHC22_32870 [Pirellulales bacterium]|nr:hypothetical protein [Pirellulales bacterium]